MTNPRRPATPRFPVRRRTISRSKPRRVRMVSATPLGRKCPPKYPRTLDPARISHRLIRRNTKSVTDSPRPVADRGRIVRATLQTELLALPESAPGVNPPDLPETELMAWLVGRSARDRTDPNSPHDRSRRCITITGGEGRPLRGFRLRAPVDLEVESARLR
jgi:hypothetical protein